MPDLRGQLLGEFDPSELFRQWDQIEMLYEKFEQVDRRKDLGLTARKFDESKTAGHRGYIIAASHLGGGLEHINVIRHLFTEYGATPKAPWTLLRAVFEAGFWSTWLLEPDNGDERRRRGLQAEIRDNRERTAFYDSFLLHDPVARQERRADHDQDEQVYRREVADMGFTWQQMRERIQVVRELERLEVVKSMEPEVRDATVAFWRSLSGMQHGLAYAMVLSGEVHSTEEILGGARQLMTINDTMFIASAGAANTLLASGLDLYIRRSTQP